MNIPTEGYLDDMNWWHNPSHPNAFTYCNLDEYYPKDYIKSAEMPEHVIQAYTKYVAEFYKKLTGKQLTSIVEFGSAGGWFLKRFEDIGYAVLGFEGSKHGVDQCIERGVHSSSIVQFDLRFPLNHFRKYDIALCCEVAEHIEEPFAAILVRNLISYSDVIWFSSEPPDTNQAHLHHCNEQPLQYWISLFDFFGYGCYLLPDYVHEKTAERGRCMFYNKQTIKL